MLVDELVMSHALKPAAGPERNGLVYEQPK